MASYMQPEDHEVREGAFQRSDASHVNGDGARGSRSRTITSRNGEGGSEESAGDSEISQGHNSKAMFAVRAGIGLLLFASVLGSVTFSKLTLVSLTNELRSLTLGNMSDNYKVKSKDRSAIAGLYWQLLLIMVLPHCVTFMRSALVGVIGKTKATYPWPSRGAMIAGVISSIVEVLAMSCFVFSVLSFLAPDLALLSMQAVFFIQFLLDVYYTPSICKCKGQPRKSRNDYSSLDPEMNSCTCLGNNESNERFSGTILQQRLLKVKNFFRLLLENKQARFLAFFLQFTGIGALIAFVVIRHAQDHDVNAKQEVYLLPVIVLPLSVTALSVVWSNKVQEYLATPESATCNPPFNARYKASFINSAIRIFLYPFLAYLVFYAIHFKNKLDPWCMISRKDKCSVHFAGENDDLSVFLTQLLTSFFGYLFSWIACIMTIHFMGFALPLLLSTPIAIGWYCLGRGHVFPFTHDQSEYISSSPLYPAAPCIWLAIYVGQLLGMAYFLCTKSNLILSQDKDMFLNPHYDGVFLEQYLTLNRQVNKYKVAAVRIAVDDQPTPKPPSRAIFICSTMFRENVREMRQMLKSIRRVSQWYNNERRKKDSNADLVESHVFFDGALNGNQLSQFALQLVSLVNDCLGVSLTRCQRHETPYGQSMTWYVGESDMRFTVHLKDNLKVKNKKRWSQVMYMNYVINHRVVHDNLDRNNTFILTTDADIDFTADSAVVLLDTLASNKEVGAVCARTHPKGSGAMYWYQVFDYAIGHWFLKPAEHLLGCVLCCPGCFSVFRCSALAEVLKEYSSEVEGAADFLTKDMGEDRWLCTLLIQKGWRLDYCAISEDYTYCPEEFDEFFKQRRRWVPSTIANILLLISKASSITKTNNSISILYVIFQAILAFSTAISPATVILIIASGLQGAYYISNEAVVATIILLLLLSVFYGLVCLYTSQKTQLDLAKLLTFLFAIVMAVVVAGIFKEIIFEIFPVDNGMKSLGPPICRNATSPTSDCMIAKNNLEIAMNMTTHSSRIPTNPTTWYIALFAVTFTIAALLHYGEWTCLVHCIWYLLALPSGYLLLLIYSAANLDSQSWGTREAATKGGGGSVMMKKWIRETLMAIRDFLKFCCGRMQQNPDEQKIPLLIAETESEDSDQEETEAESAVPVIHEKMNKNATDWLKKHECSDDIRQKFEDHGYWNLSYIASMRKEEFEAIGVEKRGFVLRLAKAAKKLPVMVIETDVPHSVAKWLDTLGMGEYTELFRAEGYKTGEDVENLKDLDKKQLSRMGITRMAHVNRLITALSSLFHPTEVEVQIHEAKRDISFIPMVDMPKEEVEFWERVMSNELKPITVRLQQTSKVIGQKLKSLRNSTLAVILLINIVWIILLYTVTFPQLEKYNLPQKAFQLVFLAVYGIIIVVSFFAMLAHRLVMLMHLLGRPQVVEKFVAPEQEQMDNLSLSPTNIAHSSTSL